jgi:PAS domain S-box-containing protein
MMTNTHPGTTPDDLAPRTDLRQGLQHELAIALDELGRAHRETRLLRLLLDAAGEDAFVATDEHGRITTWSQGAERLFGVEAAEAEGQAIEAVFAGDAELRLPWDIRAARAAGTRRFERWLTRRDGSAVHVRGTIAPLPAPAGLLLVARDDTGAELRQRDLLSRLVTAQDRERRHIGMDVHDGIGQEVTAANLLLEALRLQRDGDGFEDAFAAVQQALQRIDLELHHLTGELRPARHDLHDLPDALTTYVRQWSERSGVAADVRTRVPRGQRFGCDAERAIYRVVQEALNNVCRHARATRLRVGLEQRATELVVSITDNGTGFEPAATPTARRRETSFGLLGMHDRAALLHGSLDVDSAPGRGTTVTLSVPLLPRDDRRRATDILPETHCEDHHEPIDPTDRPDSPRVPRDAGPASDLRPGMPAVAARRTIVPRSAAGAGA